MAARRSATANPISSSGLSAGRSPNGVPSIFSRWAPSRRPSRSSRSLAMSSSRLLRSMARSSDWTATGLFDSAGALAVGGLVRAGAELFTGRDRGIVPPRLSRKRPGRTRFPSEDIELAQPSIGHPHEGRLLGGLAPRTASRLVPDVRRQFLQLLLHGHHLTPHP